MAIKLDMISSVSTRIYDLSAQLGVMEGVAQERGYPKVEGDCRPINMRESKEQKAGVIAMREEIFRIYGKMHQISVDCEEIVIPEVKEVFHKHVMLLQERRGVLEQRMRNFETLISSHVLFDEMETGIESLSEMVTTYGEEKLPYDPSFVKEDGDEENWQFLSDKLENFRSQSRIMFPDARKGQGDFCRVHSEKNHKLQQDLLDIGLKLNLKHNRLRDDAKQAAKKTLDSIIHILNNLRIRPTAHDADALKRQINALFPMLPLELRVHVYKKAGIFPAELAEHEESLAKLNNRPEWRDGLAQLQGVSYFDRERAKLAWEGQYSDMPNKRVDERHHAMKALHNNAISIPEDKFTDPKQLLLCFAQVLEDSPSYMPEDAMVKEIFDDVQGKAKPEEKKESETASVVVTESMSAGAPSAGVVDQKPVSAAQKLFDDAMREIPVYTSLDKLKAQVEAYQSAGAFSAEQKEKLVEAVLDAAMKAGLRLDADNGVYYWIWFLAHEKDASAGGDTFGKINAPKDLDRLLKAFEKAMPPAVSMQTSSLPPIVISTISSSTTHSAAPAHRPTSPTGAGSLVRPSAVVHAQRRASERSPIVQHSRNGSFVQSSATPTLEETLAEARKAASTGTVEQMSASRRPSPPPAIVSQSISALKSEPAKATPAPVITEIKVKCKVPFGHALTIKGQGGNLDWTSGKPLVKLDEETYVYRMENATGKVEYKIVLDGSIYEEGANRVIEAGKTQDVVPVLAMPKVSIVVNFSEAGKKLFIRGTGPGMSWDKSVELKPVDGKFVFETHVDTAFEFKVLRDNKDWSQGSENFKAEKGKTVVITPKF